MRRIIFYSWQSDLPNKTNRGFIQAALENAAKNITSDDTLDIEPVIDRDTQGVAGAPDISATIFAKIVAADLFVADVSITSRPTEGRPAPNPNVLIELGYALRSLGQERVVLVFNDAFGRVEELPFDLRTRRVLTYNQPAESNDKSVTRKELEKRCRDSIVSAIDHFPSRDTNLPIPAIQAIEDDLKNKVIILRRNLDHLLASIDELSPTLFRNGGTIDELLCAIEQTQEPISEFSKIAETIAIMDDQNAALECYQWFGKIFEKYNLPDGFSGSWNQADFDYFKFVGHELFVSLFAFLLRENRWTLITVLLSQPIPMRYVRYDGPGIVMWDYASEHLVSLVAESHKKQRISIHADILHTRHDSGGLAAILPFQEFADADYFLFLFGELQSEDESPRMDWRPWSALYLKRTPLFIIKAQSKSEAMNLVTAFHLPSMDEFKKRLKDRAPQLGRLFGRGWWDNPLSSDDIDRIGSR